MSDNHRLPLEPVFLAPVTGECLSQLDRTTPPLDVDAQLKPGLLAVTDLERLHLVEREPQIGFASADELEQGVDAINKSFPTTAEEIAVKFPAALLMGREFLAARRRYIAAGMIAVCGWAFSADELVARSPYHLLNLSTERLAVHQAVFANFQDRISGGKEQINTGKITKLIAVNPANQLLFLMDKPHISLSATNVKKHCSRSGYSKPQELLLQRLVNKRTVTVLGGEVVEAYENLVDFERGKQAV